MILATPKFDVVEVVHIVERTNPDPPFTEGLVGGRNDRFFHVIKKDLDRPFGVVTPDHHLVPLLVPGNLVLVFGDRFAGEKMASLEAMLALLNELEMGVNLEIKVNKGRDPIRLVDVVLPAVLAALPPERLVISSFDPVALAHCRQHAPKEALALGALFGSVPKNWREQCEAVEAFSIHPHWPRLKQTQAAAMCRDGYQILCYTANDPSAFDSRWAWGIASAITDEPAAFKRYLDNRQRAGQPA